MPLLDAVHDWLSAARSVLAGSPAIVVITLLLLGPTIVLAWRGSRIAALALFPLAALWVLVDGYVEGPVLVPFTPGHGVTMADLLSVLALGVGVSRLVGHPRRAEPVPVPTVD